MGDGVADQVFERLLQALWVRLEHQVVGRLHADDGLGGAQHFRRLPRQVGQVQEARRQGEDALVQASRVEEIGDHPLQPVHGERGLVSVARVGVPSVSSRPFAQHVEVPAQRREGRAKIVCQDSDHLGRRHAPGLLRRLPRDPLDQLGAVGDQTDPASHRLREAQILAGEGVGPRGASGSRRK